MAGSFSFAPDDPGQAADPIDYRQFMRLMPWGSWAPQDAALAASMTHQAVRPNPAAPYLEGANRIGSGVIDALMAGPRLMGDVMEGRLDPESPEAIRRSADVAMSTVGMGALGAERGAIGMAGAAHELPLRPISRANKSPSMYNPPVKEPRPFEADYPQGAQADDTGRLTRDIEGRPLTAPHVAGRTMVGGGDQRIDSAAYDALATAMVGRPATMAPARDMPGAFGRTDINRYTRQPLGIDLREGMRPETKDMVYSHEIGHVIDQLAGEISTKGLSDELKGVYHSLNSPNRAGADAASWGPQFRPNDLGYKGEAIPREYVVEAVRAYMADPNYLKTVAPNTAKRIREVVNSNPGFAKIIQFNMLPIAATAGVGAGALANDRKPFGSFAPQ